MIKWNKSSEELPYYNNPIIVYHIFDIFDPIKAEVLCGFSLGVRQVLDPINHRYCNQIHIEYPDNYESNLKNDYIGNYLYSYNFLISSYNKRGYFYWTYYEHSDSDFNMLFNREKQEFYNDDIHRDLERQLEQAIIKYNKEINIRRALE